MANAISNYLKRNETLVILCTIEVTLMIGMGIMSPSLPEYAISFGVNITMVGLLISAFGLARLFTNIPASRLSEKWGRRPVLIAGPLITTVGSIGCGLVNNYWHLLAFRLVQGIGSAMFTTVSLIMLADISTPANRGRVMSLYLGALLTGASLGPTVGGFIGEAYGLRAPFFATAAFSLAGAFLGYLRLPETRSEKIPPAGYVSMDVSPATPERGIRPLLTNINFVLASTITFSSFFMRNGAQFQILPLLEAERLSLNVGQIGITLAIISFINLGTSFFSGWLCDIFGRKIVITPSYFVATAALIMAAYTQSYWFLILTCVVWGIGNGISGAAPAAYVADVIPRSNYSMGMGMFRVASDLGFVVGPVFLGWLSDIKGFSFALLFNAGFLFLSTVIFQIFAKEPSKKR